MPGLALWGLERAPALAALARRNAAQAGIALTVAEGCVAAPPRPLRQIVFDHVIVNPPYFRREESVAGPDRLREGAMGEATPLAAWLATAARRLKPRGWLTLIHRAERLADLLAALGPLGSVQIQPLAPRAGRDAGLVLLRARKDGRAPLRLHAPVILHAGARHAADGEDYTEPVARVLRCGAPLPGFGD